MAKKVIIAEDNHDNFFLFRAMLVGKNIEVLRANNGKEAIQIYLDNRDSVALIIMDIRMPILSGDKAMKEIKRIDPNVPIIAVTAVAVDDERGKSLREGFDEYMSKPVLNDKFLDIVDRFVG